MFQASNTTNKQTISIVPELHGKKFQDNQGTHIFEPDGSFQLECGKTLKQLKISYSTYGQLNDDGSNVIWICHALTADANPKDWWQGLVGEYDFYNPDEYFIVCANVIGSAYGSTSPLDCDLDKCLDKFPTISIRDNVNAFIALRKHLKISKIHTLIGGSMGGHQAMEWAIIEPLVSTNLVLLATSAAMSPWAIAFNQSQRLAIQADASFGNNSKTAGQNGLKAARSIALLSYRNNQAYNITQQDTFDFNRTNKAASYQDYQGDKLVARFNAYSYYALTKTMDSHDVGRNRSGIEAALKLIQANTLVIGIDSDILFPLKDAQTLADSIPNAKFELIESDFGHDGFLIETKKITKSLVSFYQTQTKSAGIGLFGLGCVGQGIYRLLENTEHNIKSIAIKNEYKARAVAFEKVTSNSFKILHDKNIHTVIEAIDNEQQAFQIAGTAISQDKNFISANKKMIAENLAEIIAWNSSTKKSILYEAAVAGSIPIIRNLDLYFEPNKTHSLTAIVNGTSNYILTQMYEFNKSFDDVLIQAQQKGFAESNPISDVGGFDAKYKAIILAAHAFGVLVHPDKVKNIGIEAISLVDFKFAKDNDLYIKQVVSLKRNNKGISITIMPEFVDCDNELAKTYNENNVIILNNNKTDFIFKGAGAGSIATATAISADLTASTKRYQYDYKIDKSLQLDNDFTIKLYVNKRNYAGQIKGDILKQTKSYQIIETNYSELQNLRDNTFFIAKISGAEYEKK